MGLWVLVAFRASVFIASSLFQQLASRTFEWPAVRRRDIRVLMYPAPVCLHATERIICSPWTS